MTTHTARADQGVLAHDLWVTRELAHQQRADAFTAGWRARKVSGEQHPIDDFLFTYYSYKPSILRRWHPGAGRELADAAHMPRAAWKWYVSGEAHGSLRVDAAAYLRAKRAGVDAIRRVLERTAARPGQFSCFGLHEWAMVYRQGEHRHEVPLRLGQKGTDVVVDTHSIQCSHFDAYRFFTPEAAPLNRLRPTREAQSQLEQPGCLHAGMDVYKWAIKLGPLVPGEVLLDAFELARDIRWLDMAASPYDVSAWGAEPIAIETSEGKAEYVRQQRVFAERSNELRQRVIKALDAAEHTAEAASA
ncbi:3-methyladenine DNA glycosylase [Paramicrobacterium chengjingii]|uniref:3-methyladenine DNA glycosylase n=1 Tax=Paramicrobacterium chengjingii TaxID=2769067 RepID=UPI001FD1A764|nr:3-methyladenine DNA glycosylase [Microbacterium chengjingii]